MNVNLWNALMKSDFVFDRESYLALRQSCAYFVQHNVPQLQRLDRQQVVDFFSYTGQLMGKSLKTDARFDKVAYLCELESLYENTSEQRKRVYLRAAYDTFEQKMVMLFVAAMGIYASLCDADDDFWEPYGLNGRYLTMEEDFQEMWAEHCMKPLHDMSLSHFDRRMAIVVSSLYSLAVTLIGTEEFGLHLHNFFHYIRLDEKLELMAWMYNVR